MSIRVPTPAIPDRVYRVPPRRDGGATRYWSDTHWGHARILLLCDRPFASVEAMNAALLAACLTADGEGARLVHAGDIAWRSWRETVPVLPPLVHAAEHVLLVGNHDAALAHVEAVSADGDAEPGVPLLVPATGRLPDAWSTYVEVGRPRATEWSGWFGRIIGAPEPGVWCRYGLLLDDVLDGRPVSVLVTHAPSPDLCGADVNLHGHLHDNWDRAPEGHAAAYPFLATSGAHFNASVERTGYQPRTLQWIADAQRARGGRP
ncbi:MAG: hypothetical protein MUE41_17190 [Gemmatimonadaceae bacterium]|jgi:calcineurin-like phosphoesterase family protein|nr:hypothetical protein [Gemmatimonadaceae bacterium]